jgi:hypothetical protein
MSSFDKTTSISEMIHRFRTARPTSRAHRDAMRRNGDLPNRMWWEESRKILKEDDEKEPKSSKKILNSLGKHEL